MILFFILIISFFIKFFSINYREKKFILLNVFLILIFVGIQVYILHVHFGVYTVGSDAGWYFSNGKNLIRNIPQFNTLNDFFSFFENNNIASKYILYTIYNALCIVEGSEILSAIFLQLNYGIIIVLFLITVINYVKKNNFQINYTLLLSVAFYLYWTMLLNFRDGFITIFIILIVLAYYYETNLRRKLVKLVFYGILLYFTRNEFLFILVGILIFESLVYNKFFKFKKCFLIVSLIIIPLIISKILNKSFIKIVNGNILSLLVNNPIKFLIYFISGIGIESSWIITKISLFLFIIINFITIFLVYPLYVDGIMRKKKDTITRLGMVASIFLICVFSFYSQEFGAVQDRVKNIPFSLVLIYGLFKIDKNIYLKYVVIASSYVFMVVHTLFSLRIL